MSKLIALGLAIALFSGSAFAVTIQTIGVGSAVTTVNASADFERNPAALFDNPYSEGNMLFSRTGLDFGNSGCGFAGCPGSFPPEFIGNYMYGQGSGGYFEIAAASGNVFKGLEFTTGTGYGLTDSTILWETYDANSSLVDTGLVSLPVGQVIGFSDATGFVKLKFTSNEFVSSPDSLPDFLTTNNAPAFDSVRAEFTANPNLNPVPEPGTWFLMSTGLVGLLGYGWRRRQRTI